MRWQRGVLTGAAAAAASLYSYARFIEPRRPVLERLSLPIVGLPSALDGFTIAHLTDFHYWPHTRLPYIRQIVAQVNGLQPDVVALTGDYICREAPRIFDIAPVLAELQAQHGVYAVIGNHDTSCIVPHKQQIVTYGLDYYGIAVLHNRHVRLRDGLVIAGIDELYRGRPNLGQALAGVTEDECVILLVHQPDFADVSVRDSRIRLQLSGHTHGGQFLLPGVRPLYLPTFGRNYVRGLYQVGPMWLYVNRGVGVSQTGPLRFRCPPEIALITLRRARSAA